MFTYVINTSENKTFDNSRLFDLAGYNRILWRNCHLNELGDCAKEILERQNILAAENFSVAIIVDFFGFDRIREPYGYGKDGFGKEEGVDLSLYIPYIEAYITDKVVAFLEKYELIADRYDVYYVQSKKFERYEFLDNAKDQVRFILKGVQQDDLDKVLVKHLEADKKSGKYTDEQMVERREIIHKDLETNPPYKVFSLYCTPEISLDFVIKDYPYGTSDESLNFDQFFTAFRDRASLHSQKIRHYHYLTAYGGGPIRAAFDTLCLSLYLVYVYEREEIPDNATDLEIAHLDSAALKDVLVTAWSKISVARNIATENRSSYYSLDLNLGEIQHNLEVRKSTSAEDEILQERIKLQKEIKDQKISADTMFHSILNCADKTKAKLDEERQKELDELIRLYLCKRDETNESSVEADFEELRRIGAMKMVQQCPSNADFQYAIKKKEEEISDLFETALAAEYIEVNYDEEKQKAKDAYKEYNRIRACMNKNFIADLVFLIITVLVAVLPYDKLQLSHTELFVFSAYVLRLTTLAVFGGLFLLSLSVNVFLLARKLKKQKDIIRDCYLNCLSKERYSFSALRRRYERDLIRIEEARYETRLIKHLHEENARKDRNITLHRNMLEEIQDNLSGMFSNMEIEPVFNPDESVFGEFDLTKSFRAKDNKIYQIFSIEAIEKMFHKKGSDEP